MPTNDAKPKDEPGAVAEQPPAAEPAEKTYTEAEVADLRARLEEAEKAANAAATTEKSSKSKSDVPGEFPTGDSWGVGAEYQFPGDARVFAHTENGWVQAR